jgi:hypothetical protein
MSRTSTIYYNVVSRRAVDSTGSDLGSDAKPYIRFREQPVFDLRFVNSDLTPYTGLASAVSFSAAVDNDWRHYIIGTTEDALDGALTSIDVLGVSAADSASLPKTGSAIIVDASGQTDSFAYSALTIGATNWSVFDAAQRRHRLLPGRRARQLRCAQQP